jgi:hypothetical protein
MGVHDSLQDEGEGLHRGTCTLGCVQSSLDLDRRKANAEPARRCAILGRLSVALDVPSLWWCGVCMAAVNTRGRGWSTTPGQGQEADATV